MQKCIDVLKKKLADKPDIWKGAKVGEIKGNVNYANTLFSEKYLGKRYYT